jgi:hypothetical protein
MCQEIGSDKSNYVLLAEPGVGEHGIYNLEHVRIPVIALPCDKRGQ